MAKLAEVFQKGYDSLNRAGGPAFALDLKERFATRLMTCLVGEPKFYGDTTQELVDETKRLCQQDPMFVLQAAIYAREQMFLRTAPLILLRWLVPCLSRRDLTIGVQRICTRPDQLVDLMHYYHSTQEKRTVANNLKSAIRTKLTQYSQYQLAKYPAGLKSLIKLSHPPRSEDFHALIENRMAPPLTWEVELTRHGNKAEVWDRLLAEDAVPYMALIRNLRNILGSGANSIGLVCDRLEDPARVRGSKQFPFRFLSSLRALEQSDLKHDGRYGQAIDALSKAFEISLGNLPHLPGRTVFLIDHSGSMKRQLSSRGSVSYMDVADTLAIVGAVMCESALPVAFASEAAVIEVPPGLSTLKAIGAMQNIDVGYATALAKGFDLLRTLSIGADRVIILSDMQAWKASSGRFAQDVSQTWRAAHSPNAWIHSIDLAGYGTTQIQGGKVSLIAGWSDRVVRLLPLIEAGGDAFVQAIEGVNLYVSNPVEEEADDRRS